MLVTNGTHQLFTEPDSVGYMAVAGKANDPAFDNTAALISLLEQGYKVIYFEPGEWHFQGTLGIEELADPSIFDNVSILGAGNEYSWQHQEQTLEAGDLNDKYLTRFVLHMESASDIWWEQIRASVRFGPIRIENISFRIPAGGTGSVFSFGDMEETNANTCTMRGLHIRNCYGSFYDHLVGSYLTEDDGVWTINRTNPSFFIRARFCYDVVLRDVAALGFHTNVILMHCDRPVLDNVRGGLCGRHIDCHAIYGVNNAPVVGHGTALWCEGAYINGFNLESMEVHSLRHEGGYSSGYEPNIGAPEPRALPANVSWGVTAGTATLTLSGAGMTGRTASDFFEPRTVIRVTPDQTNEPEYYFYIDDVGASSLALRNANGFASSHVPRAISGAGTGITRFFGAPLNIVGSQAAVVGFSLSINHPVSDFPRMFIVPGPLPITVAGETEGLSSNTSAESTRPVVVASCTGAQFALHGGVDWFGSTEAPDHPLVNRHGDGAEYDPNYRDMEVERIVVLENDEWTPKIRHVARPGRGIITGWDCGTKLTFRKRDGVWVHRLSDMPSPAGWRIQSLRQSGKGLGYVIRCYAFSDDQTLIVSGLSGSNESHTGLDIGWHTLKGSLSDAQVDVDTIRLTGGDVDVAWVELIQDYPSLT